MESVTIMRKIGLEAEAAKFHCVVFDELRHLTPKPTMTVQTTAFPAECSCHHHLDNHWKVSLCCMSDEFQFHNAHTSPVGLPLYWPSTNLAAPSLLLPGNPALLDW